MNYEERLLRTIPGGAHTYSRGYDQFPSNAPQILARGKGAFVFDPQENRFLDYGMGLRSVNIGYSEDAIDAAAFAQIKNGNNLTRPSLVELEAAEKLIEIIDSADMVKFTKNGSSAVTAAIKLSRAYTGKEFVARCAEHPFFSYDDWFIGSTPITRGVTQDSIQKIKSFSYNDIGSLESLISEYPNKFACVILEPSTVEEPLDGFLLKVQDLCRKNGIIFILDEMITGFRWHIKGAQFRYDVKPDLCTFGKAMANGFSVACVAGRREVMELGSIEHAGKERIFLLSTTHGAEMSGLGAFVETLSFMQTHNVIKHIWDYGEKLIAMVQRKARDYEIDHSFKFQGIPCSPYYLTLDQTGVNSLALRTLFMQEMVKSGVLIPWVALSYRHGQAELDMTEHALDSAFKIYARAIHEGVDKHLCGHVIKPVFRKYN